MSLSHAPVLRPTSDYLMVGDAELIDVFFGETLRVEISRTWILVPYVERTALEDDLLRHSWNRLAVVGDGGSLSDREQRGEAIRLSLANPERIDLRVEPTLHAKLFVATSAVGCVALIGSQNLTSAALHTNIEAAFSFAARALRNLRRLVASLRARAEVVTRAARPWMRARR